MSSGENPRKKCPKLCSENAGEPENERDDRPKVNGWSGSMNSTLG